MGIDKDRIPRAVRIKQMAVQMAENGEGDWNPSETNADGGDEGRIQVDLNTINWTPTPTGNIVLHLPSEYDAVLQRTGENDPALFIAWDIDTIVNAVLSINMNSPQNGLLGILGFPIVTSDFVGAIAEYGAQFSAAGSNIRNSMIAPNTVIEYCGIWCALRALGFHPYLVQLHNQGRLPLPLGWIYIITEGSRPITATPDPGLPLPGVPNGIVLFQ